MRERENGPCEEPREWESEGRKERAAAAERGIGGKWSRLGGGGDGAGGALT